MSNERLPGHRFSEAEYLQINPDVNAEVQNGRVDSGWQHFMTFGFRENRGGVPPDLVGKLKSLFDADLADTLPPAHLRKRVHGAEDAASFQSIGRAVALDLFAAVNSTFDLEPHSKVLDFGCGSGRVLNFFHKLCGDCTFFGTDIDDEAIAWCQQQMSHVGTFSSNRVMPPLQYEASFFDFVFSISIFTHLPEEMQFAWLAELGRVTKRGGYLILTTHGEDIIQPFPEHLKRIFNKKGFYYHVGEETEGLPAFYQTSFHTEDYIHKVWGKYFEIVKIIRKGIVGHQDMVICRKKP